MPATGTLPLGTGNDLARALGWGGGYHGEPVAAHLRDLDTAYEIQTDRWRLTLVQADPAVRTVMCVCACEKGRESVERRVCARAWKE